MTSEFEFIDKLRRKFARTGKRVLTGIGDDAAVIAQSSRRDIVVSADLLVEDIDFQLSWITPRQLGHKALAVSLSDIAAMGANPLWSTISIGIPQVLWEGDFLKGFYQGWQELADKHRVSLVGGDISETPNKVVIDSVVGGEVRKGRAVKRTGARPGDLLYVTGELGGAAAGLKILQNGEGRSGSTAKLIDRQLTPIPRCEIGKILGELKIATAMIDISDGLSPDLAHICRESGVGARVYQDKIPVDKALKALNFPDELELALSGGEDFELLFTIPARLRKDLRNKLEKLPATRIGEITEEANKLELHGPEGVRELKPDGFKHFQ
jgi:thiamine-monophosphate kinase